MAGYVLNYPITVTPDGTTLVVDFVDFPEAHSVGDTLDEAHREAVDGLITTVELYMDDRRMVPMPSIAAEGQHTIPLPAIETAKVLLWNEMLQQKMRKADLARKMQVHQPQIDRLFDLRHAPSWNLWNKRLRR